jgi:diadenosine tetraphosphatase ApaH/serine/threonine PP2A family protein phosphatase
MRRPLLALPLLLLLALPARSGAQPAAPPGPLATERSVHPASIDGPYVFTRDGKREQLRLHRTATGTIEAKRSALTAATVEVEVDAPGTPRFRVPLRREHPRRATSFPRPSRLLVASDFEGQFEAFTSLMQANGVLDAQLHWRFGKGHVVLVGDLVDRGPNVLPLLWLVYRMEAEAQAAGGALHYVLGNHEQMLLTGQTRYLHPKYLETLRLAGQPHQALWDEHSELGRWLRSKPVLLRVGDHLFAHGGISPEVLALRPTLEQVDRSAATAFAQDPRTLTDARAKALLWDRRGLLWYRGLAMDMPEIPMAPAAHVQQVLRHFGVRHVVIGHTLVEHVGHGYGGAVLRVDVDQAAGTREALLLEKGKAHRVDARGKRSALEAATNAD